MIGRRGFLGALIGLAFAPFVKRQAKPLPAEIQVNGSVREIVDIDYENRVVTFGPDKSREYIYPASTLWCECAYSFEWTGAWKDNGFVPAACPRCHAKPRSKYRCVSVPKFEMWRS